MTTVNLDPLVTRLHDHLTDLGDGRDARSDNERATYRTACDATQRTLSGLRNAPSDLARIEAQLTDALASRDDGVAKQGAIEESIATAPALDTCPNARERDKEYARQQNLHRRLAMLREGTLRRAPGVTYESPASLDARIAELTERRDRAQRALDGYVAAAEALLAAVPVAA